MNIKTIITELLDKPIAFNRSFAKICQNNLNAGMLLSQLFYWFKTMDCKEFYKKNEELQDECFLSRYEFEQARKKLLNIGVLKMKKKGVPCITYYQIDCDILIEKLSELQNKKYNCDSQTSLIETDKLECQKLTNCNDRNSQTEMSETDKLYIYTKNTTKNTTDILNNKKNKVEFDYLGFNEKEIKVIKDWLEHKKEKKQAYKTQQSLDALKNKLLELKNNNKLIESIEFSLMQNYSGIFDKPEYIFKKQKLTERELFDAPKDYSDNQW